MKTAKVLDSYALLSYLQGEAGSAAVKTAFAAAATGGVLMNEINVGEVYYILARGRGCERADFFLHSVLPHLPIRVVGNDFEAVIRAAKIKAGHPLAYADCFAVATAAAEDASLLTGDPEFKAVESLIEIEWLD